MHYAENKKVNVMPKISSCVQRIKKLEKEIRQQKEASHKNAEAARENRQEIQEMKYREAHRMLQKKSLTGNIFILTKKSLSN